MRGGDNIEELKNIAFKVPKSLMTDIKRRIIDLDKNLNEYIISMILEDLEKGKKKK
jgi:hypothetical protein